MPEVKEVGGMGERRDRKLIYGVIAGVWVFSLVATWYITGITVSVQQMEMCEEMKYAGFER